MPSAIGRMAEKYVMRAPLRYSGTRGPGTLVIVQHASGMLRCAAIDACPSSLLVMASVAAGACSLTSVISLAATARATVCVDDVCLWIHASRCTGSARWVPS